MTIHLFGRHPALLFSDPDVQCLLPSTDDMYTYYGWPQVREEYNDPKSQDRIPCGKIPQMWGQSLYVIGRLLKEVSHL